MSDSIPTQLAVTQQAQPSSQEVKPAAHQSHLSPYAIHQLTAAGVSPQLLQQIQAATLDVPPYHPVSVAALKASAGHRTRSNASFRKRAHLLNVRQGKILKQIQELEGDAAQCSETSLVKPGLKWQTVKPKLQVGFEQVDASSACHTIASFTI